MLKIKCFRKEVYLLTYYRPSHIAWYLSLGKEAWSAFKSSEGQLLLVDLAAWQGNFSRYRDQWASSPKEMFIILVYRLSLEGDPVTLKDHFISKIQSNQGPVGSQWSPTHCDLKGTGNSFFLKPASLLPGRELRGICLVASLPDTSH